MKNKIIGIYGASGFGREIMPLVREQFKDIADFVFIDDASELNEINGHSVLSYEEFLAKNYQDKSVAIAIADGKIREKLSQKLSADNINHINIKASNAVLLDENAIAEGVMLCPFTTITSNTRIGKFFQANIYSYVAHDCVIGDFVTFAPSVKCNGNVHIENHVYIGTGAMIKQGTPNKPIVIGEGAVIGMGSVVTKSVKAGDVVFGIPAKSIKRGG